MDSTGAIRVKSQALGPPQWYNEGMRVNTAVPPTLDPAGLRTNNPEVEDFIVITTVENYTQIARELTISVMFKGKDKASIIITA